MRNQGFHIIHTPKATAPTFFRLAANKHGPAEIGAGSAIPARAVACWSAAKPAGEIIPTGR